MTIERRLHIGLMLPGTGPGRTAWRNPEAPRDAATNFDFYLQQTTLAEKGKLDFVFLADHPYASPSAPPLLLNRFEPLTLLSALAVSTSNIGLVATASISFTEPFNVARQYASLDLLSGGRAAWNVVTTGYEDAALNYNKSGHAPHAERYKQAAEHLDTVRGLWDSWEAGAFIEDRNTGTFYDPAKLHILDHKGPYYQVKGPLNVGPSRQGQPLIFQAGSSEDGRNLAAASADAIFTGPPTFEDAQAFYRDIKRRTVAHGRPANAINVLPGITPIIADTEEEARGRYQQILAEIDPLDALKALAVVYAGVDLTQFDLDAPFPDLGDIGKNGFKSATERYQRLAKQNGWTLRQLAIWYVAPRDTFVGTAQTVADTFAKWFQNEASDGFILVGTGARELADVVEKLVPELQDRGLFRNDYTGTTLRSHFDLPVPVNRHLSADLQQAG